MNAATALHLDTHANFSVVRASANGQTWTRRVSGGDHRAQAQGLVAEARTWIAAQTAATAPVWMPRKGAVLLINGVRHTVERRYCHGMRFDLRGPGGEFVAASDTSLARGLADGSIIRA